MIDAPSAPSRPKAPALAVLFLVVFINLVGFGLVVPLLPFFAQSLNAEPWQITVMFSAYSLGQFFAEPFWGRLSDRIGRKPVMIAFGVLGVLCTVPIMTMLGRVESPYAAFALMMAALVIVSGYTAINAVVKAELFPAHIRALGVALPYAIANALFGGTAEYVAFWLKLEGIESVYFWYVTGMIGVSLLTYVFMRDTKHRSLIS